ncbi:S26 family signal peptidase [Microbispora siamensis]|uniref:S26 family signal peptidase n=1 Tax=Microbispora siamensis TaxID=564413 RepID=UPI00194F77FA|nr:S26 family signal peptidase [Microbispora siamensis]
MTVLLFLIPLAAGLATALRRGALLVTVRGASMEPAYHDGDRLLVLRMRWVRRGRTVVFRAPATWPVGPPGFGPYLVKRVVAVPGDPVPEGMRGVAATERVPRGRVVVYGDSAHSADSRDWGFLPVRALTGVVVAVLERAPRPPVRPSSPSGREAQ